LIWYSAPSSDPGFGGAYAYWDAATGEPVYIHRFSDVFWGICQAHTYRFGEEPEPCDEVVTCQVCGSEAPDVERCPVD
jgi:hypothetical protein